MVEFKFQSKLECIASGMNYFAIPVPKKITTALGTTGPVAVAAQVNKSEVFKASLYPIGGGKHYLRVKNKICSSIKINEGDRVTVKFTIRDRKSEITIPEDLKTSLKEAGLEKEFKSIPIGKKSYLLRTIEEAVKPQTREKRIISLLEEAKRRKK